MLTGDKKWMEKTETRQKRGDHARASEGNCLRRVIESF